MVDLGSSPPSNAYLTKDLLNFPEKWFPLRVLVCENCWLVQTEDYTSAEELFSSDYAYFSSISSAWLDHAGRYVNEMIPKLGLGTDSFVIEVASNDGYLLRNFLEKEIPCLGIEPTNSTAEAAESLGIQVLREFLTESLGQQLACEGRLADLVIGNNVYAHVPEINDFTLGLKAILKPGGTITLEFPHLLQLIKLCQFDTIYHEHFSYLSLFVVDKIFKMAGLRVYDVETVSTHGGSLRVYGCHEDDQRISNSSVDEILALEKNEGLQSPLAYLNFQSRVDTIKDQLRLFLIEQKEQGKTVAGYGAAAKGNTLLNYAGVRPDLLPYVCDAAPSKQGKYLPGSRIPICSPNRLTNSPPDFLIILPWNIAAEIMQQMTPLVSQGTKILTVMPKIDYL